MTCERFGPFNGIIYYRITNKKRVGIAYYGHQSKRIQRDLSVATAPVYSRVAIELTSDRLTQYPMEEHTSRPCHHVVDMPA